MQKFSNLNHQKVFQFFEQISAIPRGSGNMNKIAEYCENFAKKRNLKYIRDDADNVVIFKPATADMDGAGSVILQGHLDMVCQKIRTSPQDFERDGIELVVDGDFVKANGTTLGADNGIAVAIILAILDSCDISHPPIEAVFTVDEEIGMLGAMKLDMSVFDARKMINLDSEEEGIITVSCAGGGDFTARIPIRREKKQGSKVTISLSGLKGGHSGMEINSGRVNADLTIGRILDKIRRDCDFDIISVAGGDKTNAIANSAYAEMCVYDVEMFCEVANRSIDEVKNEILCREPKTEASIDIGERGQYEVFDKDTADNVISALICVPNGVIEMSAQIEGLVETSLNLGILKTYDDEVVMGLSLRSSQKSALDFLTRRLEAMFDRFGFQNDTSGYYPPWEYKEESELRDIFSSVYCEKCGKEAQIAAIHAGLECGVFSSGIPGLDCISVGPEMSGVHTTEERLSISSTQRLFDVITDVLRKLK